MRQESQMPCIYKLISFYPIQPNEEKELTLLLFVTARPAAKPHRFCCRHIQIPERRCNYGFNFYYRNVYPPCGYSLSHHRLHHEEMTICCAAGALLACTAQQKFSVDIIVAGAVSGLASTGLHQAFRQLIDGRE